MDFFKITFNITNNFIKLLFINFFTIIFIMSSSNAASKNDLDNILYLDTTYGRVIIEMYPDVAPNHVSRIKELVRANFYDGVKFHRVIAGFMAQTGDPLGNGTGGSGQNLKQEFSDIAHKRGIVSMARAMDPNSADSQFFIVYQDAFHLDGQYTVWGKVTSGMEYIDSLKKGENAANGMVQNPDIIVKMSVAADEKTAKTAN